MTTQNDNDAALDAYLGARCKTLDLLDRIKIAAEAHQDRQPPEAIHWGHVSDLNHAIELLHEVETFLTGKVA
jgi:hypothetical protein